jgi:16S rRNA (cytidine1402-2'-O)-methyltransferase
MSLWVSEDSHRVKGEFVLVIHPVEGEAVKGAMGDRIANSSDRVLKALMKELPLKTAVKLAAELTGAPKNALYEQALAIKSAEG